MNIEQIYTNCLAQGAYFIMSKGEAAVIDPLRETEPYLQRAKDNNVKIKYIFETHFHADFVSGHLDLAKKTGAKIVYGPSAETNFDIHQAKDGEVFVIGDLTIKALHTPGHTPESTTYLLLDPEGKENAIFTGDTLFIGDVGRPDLAQKSTGLTQEDLAGWLFDSLRNKIMTLPDDVIVYPAHGAGSACGKNMSSQTWDLLGNQKKTNYALRTNMTKQEFINEVTTGLLAPPQYFSKNASLNKKGYGSIDQVMEAGAKALSIVDFNVLLTQDDILTIDTRSKEEFVNGFIPGSIFIGLGGSFAPWVGALVADINQKIMLVTEEGKEQEAVMRLARVGYDNAIGYLAGGFQKWKNSNGKIATLKTNNIDQLLDTYNTNKNINILDVRKQGEFDSSHISTAEHIALADLQQNLDKLEANNRYYLHCKSGYRATVAASILLKNGFGNTVVFHGSVEDLLSADITDVCETICQG